MSQRASFWGGVCLVSVALGGCLLADVGIDPALDEEATVGAAQGGGDGNGGSGGNGSGGSASAQGGSGGGSGAGAMAEAGSGGDGGSAGSQGLPPGGGAGTGPGSSGNAGSGGMAPNPGGMAGAGGLSMSTCLTGLDREQACAAYCGTYEEACRGLTLPRVSTGEMDTPYTYANAEECAQICRDSDWVIGNIGVLGSIMCRCHHATLAVDEGPNPHCFHAAEVPSEGGCAVPAGQ